MEKQFECSREWRSSWVFGRARAGALHCCLFGVAGTQAREDIEVLELPLQETLPTVLGGDIRNGKTIMLLQHAALVGLDRLASTA